MKKNLITAAFALCVTAVMIAYLFLVLRLTIKQPAYFAGRYEELDIESSTGISVGDCTRAVYRLVEYMEGGVDDIQLTVSENGSDVEMYNWQEIEHMKDVRALYQGFRAFMWISFGLFGLSLVLIIWKKELAALWEGGLIWALAVILAAVLILGAWVLIDFNSFWTGFHRLFFTNDLWLMNPAVCRMIRICPIELFYGIVLRIGLCFIAVIALMCATSIAHRRKNKNAEGKA